MAGPTARTQSSKHHIFLMTIFILAIIALLIQDDLIHTVSGYFRSGDPSKYASLTGSSTFKGLNPDMYSPTEKGRKMTFRTIPELEDLSHAGDDHWYGEISSANDSHWIHVLTAEDYDYYTTRHPPLIMTHGAGMLNVKYNETLAVPFGITMFHALHCLGSIRSALQDAMGKEHKDHGKEERDGHHDALISDMHVGHCFAYIAQVRTVYTFSSSRTITCTLLPLRYNN